jgi:hypothetical protein
MPDDRKNRGRQDRARVASEQQYEVEYFAQKHGISVEDAQKIIEAAGPSREDADERARRMKAPS